jgi:hypothetical protein
MNDMIKGFKVLQKIHFLNHYKLKSSILRIYKTGSDEEIFSTIKIGVLGITNSFINQGC